MRAENSLLIARRRLGLIESGNAHRLSHRSPHTLLVLHCGLTTCAG